MNEGRIFEAIQVNPLDSDKPKAYSSSFSSTSISLQNIEHSR